LKADPITMNFHRLVLKVFAEGGSDVNASVLVPVFHGFIQNNAIEDHLLIDVADYDHVHHGPGTLLVSHEANFAMDRGGGRLGLLYQRKQPLPGRTFRERLGQVVYATLRAAARLEEDPALHSRLKFRTDELLFRVADRLLAPNTPDTFNAAKGELQSFFSDLYEGGAVTLTHNASPQNLFEVSIRPSRPRPIPDLLQRLERLGPTPAAAAS
jgi:hypothetical protein